MKNPTREFISAFFSLLCQTAIYESFFFLGNCGKKGFPFSRNLPMSSSHEGGLTSFRLGFSSLNGRNLARKLFQLNSEKEGFFIIFALRKCLAFIHECIFVTLEKKHNKHFKSNYFHFKTVRKKFESEDYQQILKVQKNSGIHFFPVFNAEEKSCPVFFPENSTQTCHFQIFRKFFSKPMSLKVLSMLPNLSRNIFSGTNSININFPKCPVNFSPKKGISSI